MGKAKTSKKQKHFSVEDMTSGKLKAGVKTTPYSPTAHLADGAFIAEALFECMLDDDMEAFKDILRAHYEAINITKALKASGLSKRTFYGALSPKGNPSLETVMKMVSGLKHENQIT